MSRESKRLKARANFLRWSAQRQAAEPPEPEAPVHSLLDLSEPIKAKPSPFKAASGSRLNKRRRAELRAKLGLANIQRVQ